MKKLHLRMELLGRNFERDILECTDRYELFSTNLEISNGKNFCIFPFGNNSVEGT